MNWREQVKIIYRDRKRELIAIERKHMDFPSLELREDIKFRTGYLEGIMAIMRLSEQEQELELPGLFPVVEEKPKASSPTRALIDAYCAEFKVRYGTFPVVMGKEAGICADLVKQLGASRALNLVQTYLTMGQYEAQKHNLGTLRMNLNAVAVKLDTGNSVTNAELRQSDNRQTNVNAFGHLLGKGGNGR